MIFARFVVASGIAAMANFGSRILLGYVVPYIPSIVIAYLIGMTTAFILNRLFVFRHSKRAMHSQATRFVAVNALAVLQTVAFSVLFARVVFPAMGVTFHPETIAHAIGVIVPVFTSYLGHKHWTFGSNAGHP
ncbi:GtrA family protein [Lysobacter soli]|uniref:GtrA family protein n=1 Tax=Lysobacter soli TaxID=453783 RepID=UPI0020A10F49|nr:GtrA family protein [Lysobacter soli]UTA54187.1 GtrA family protein [Lysobacter soli]